MISIKSIIETQKYTEEQAMDEVAITELANQLEDFDYENLLEKLEFEFEVI